MEQHQDVNRRALDRERKRLASERQSRMRGASNSWTQHVRNAVMRKYHSPKNLKPKGGK